MNYQLWINNYEVCSWGLPSCDSEDESWMWNQIVQLMYERSGPNLHHVDMLVCGCRSVQVCEVVYVCAHIREKGGAREKARGRGRWGGEQEQSPASGLFKPWENKHPHSCSPWALLWGALLFLLGAVPSHTGLGTLHWASWPGRDGLPVSPLMLWPCMFALRCSASVGSPGGGWGSGSSSAWLPALLPAIPWREREGEGQQSWCWG